MQVHSSSSRSSDIELELSTPLEFSRLLVQVDPVETDRHLSFLFLLEEGHRNHCVALDSPSIAPYSQL